MRNDYNVARQNVTGTPGGHHPPRVPELWTLNVVNIPRVFILTVALACGGCVWRSDVSCETSGKVLDDQTRQPVPYARMYDKRYPEQIVTASADGSFDFPRIVAWSHVHMLFPGPDLTTNRFLVVEAPGYHTAEVNMPLQFDWFGRIIYLTPDTKPGVDRQGVK